MITSTAIDKCEEDACFPYAKRCSHEWSDNHSRDNNHKHYLVSNARTTLEWGKWLELEKTTPMPLGKYLRDLFP